MMKERKYVSGQFCIDIKCPYHVALDGLKGDAYMKKKAVQCKACPAWQFYLWLKDHRYRIVMTVPEMSARELAAHIKGVDPVKVEDLTLDEILCL